MQHFHHDIDAKLKANKEFIQTWLSSLENKKELPLYTSVDIRDSGFKSAVVDSNLFPAGFNNLCETSLKHAQSIIRNAISNRVPDCKNILIIAEEHTRNKFYLENVRTIETLLKNANFNVMTATFFDTQPNLCDTYGYMVLETASGHPFKMYCLRHILSEFSPNKFDFILLNNDLTGGIPDILKATDIPIYPSIHAGWHSRLKSHHFRHANLLIEELCKTLDIDPWFLSCIFSTAEKIDINNDSDRNILADQANEVFKKIHRKYAEHKIQDKPFLFIKSDSGTYGMGVLAIEDPKDILTLNRKARNTLHKGKGSQRIERLIIQEGVPSIESINHSVAEACIYSIDNQFIGGFYRINTQKSNRDNLNSQGMTFKKMCGAPDRQCSLTQDPQFNFETCGINPSETIDLYRLLARIAGIAAQREISDFPKK